MRTKIDKTQIIRDIKTYYNFKKDSHFAKFLEIKPQTLSSWYTRNTFDIELLYAKCVDINPHWLITGTGNMLIEEQENSESNSTTDNDRMPKVVTVDNDERDNIVLVPQKAAAGYLNSYNDPKFIKQLPSYRMPNINNGTYRMFQLDGHSMHPTMQDSSYVVCEWVENWEEDIKDDRVYVVVSIDDGVVIKRVLNRLNKYGSLYCKSDNRREYHNFAVKKESIKEVWHVKMHMTFEIPNPVSLYERMNDLEAELEHIKSLNIELRQ